MPDNHLYECPACGKGCEIYQADDGIGPYEFWGRKGVDSRPYWASTCCDADVSDQVEPRDDDYEYELRRDRDL